MNNRTIEEDLLKSITDTINTLDIIIKNNIKIERILTDVLIDAKNVLLENLNDLSRFLPESLDLYNRTKQSIDNIDKVLRSLKLQIFKNEP